MDYYKNADRINIMGSGLSYNQLLDCSFDEGGSAPAEPVTLAEAKIFCRIDVNDDDAIISSLITAARQMCENYTNIGFIQRTVTATFNNENGGFFLPYGPVNSVVSAHDGNANVVTDPEISGTEWKQVLSPQIDRMQVEYVAGYPVLPANLKTALLNAIMWLYDNRSQGNETIGPIATTLLNPIRRVW